jgi:hypothetical protein
MDGLDVQHLLAPAGPNITELTDIVVSTKEATKKKGAKPVTETTEEEEEEEEEPQE